MLGSMAIPLEEPAGTLSPRSHQVAALHGVTAELGRADRAQLVMACGSGKTLVGRWLAEGLAADVVLVVAPSLALVAQTLRAWEAVDGWDFEPLVVCSDPSTAAGARERTGPASGRQEPAWGQATCVTTSPVLVKRRLSMARPRKRPLVVFSTYHSSPVVAQAAAAAGAVFDLVIADEAHRLAREPSSAFRTVLEAGFPARKRLFMTATQVVTTPGSEASDGARCLLSMDDPFTFGRVAYRLDFAEAIARGILSDYRVLVFESPDSEGVDPAAAVAAAADRGLTRVLSFHGRVAKAKEFARSLDGQVARDGRRVVAKAVSGLDSAAQREAAMQLLRSAAPDQIVVIASARCLTEGVDVPSVDGVLFADPKHSDVDIVQSIGRVLRHDPGKSIGHVLIPVPASSDLDDGSALSAGPFFAAWRILRALRSVDPRLSEQMRAIAGGFSRRGRHGQHARTPALVEFCFPSAPDIAELAARLVDSSTRRWWWMFERVEAHVVTDGQWPAAGGALDQWCRRQRIAYSRDLLEPLQVAALEGVPGWAWDHQARRWLEQLAVMSELAGQGLDLHDGDAMERPVPHSSARGAPKTVGQWCAAQRIAARRGDLPSGRRDRLQSLPGWAWDAIGQRDATFVDLLSEWVAWKKDANVPADVVEDDLPLGQWLQEIRSRKIRGALSQPLLDELVHVTPHPQSPGALRWEANATHWRLCLAALQQFVAREACTPPQGHVEKVQGYLVELGQWCNRQRYLYRRGQLTPESVATLETVSGWLWNPGPAKGTGRSAVGRRQHGTRAAYSAGCRCDECRAANSTYERARKNPPAGQLATDLVDAGRARKHVLGLIERGLLQGEIARAAGVSGAAISKLATGRVTRIRMSAEDALLAVRDPQ